VSHRHPRGARRVAGRSSPTRRSCPGARAWGSCSASAAWSPGSPRATGSPSRGSAGPAGSANTAPPVGRTSTSARRTRVFGRRGLGRVRAGLWRLRGQGPRRDRSLRGRPAHLRRAHHVQGGEGVQGASVRPGGHLRGRGPGPPGAAVRPDRRRSGGGHRPGRREAADGQRPGGRLHGERPGAGSGRGDQGARLDQMLARATP